MGRPSKNNCDYFRHFTTMRNHRKVKALRNKFGQVLGYAFWSMILEYLTEADGNEIELSDVEIELFGGELGVSATEIRSMVDFCVMMEMLFIREGFIHSESLDEDLEFVYKKRKTAKERSSTRKRRKDGTFRKNDLNGGIVVTETANGLDIVAPISPQIRVDKSIKENKEKEQEQIFQTFQKLYGGRKGGVKTEFKNLKKHKDWETVLPQLEPSLKKEIAMRAKYAALNQWFPDWKNLQTWLSKRSWEQEFPEMEQKANGEAKHTEYIVNPDKFYGRE